MSEKKEKSDSGGRIVYHESEDYRPILGDPQVPAEWQKARRGHYAEWLGTPSHVWHSDTSLVPHIDVLLYEPAESLGRRYYTLITDGMSDARMMLPSEVEDLSGRAELIQYVGEVDLEAAKVQPPWFVRAMFYLARFPFAYRTWLGVSHTVPNGEPPAPFCPASQLVAALFMAPVFEPEGFRQGLSVAGDQVDFLWLTFITKAELAFKLTEGYAALVERFQAGRFPQLLDPYRASLA